MATQTGQHSVSPFLYPQNGTSPIDADEVKANDNALRTAYNTHDSDTGIHVQSSTLALRPSAGTAGRKWITVDKGNYILWYDDGSRWHEVSSEQISLEFRATATIVKGDVLKVTGWNNGQNLPELAPLTSASDVAFAIAEENVTNGTNGYAINTGFLEDVDTSLFSVGDRLYPNASAGPGSITSWFTDTKPTSGEYQVAAYVLRSNSSNGVLFVEFSGPRIAETSSNTANTVVQRDGSGNFSAGTITASLTGSVTGNVTGNADTATKLSSSRTFALTGDVTGSVSSDLTSGASISTSIASGSIVNADVSATAEIDVSKLADGSARQLLQTDAAGTGVEWTSNVDVPGTLDVTGAVTLDNSALSINSVSYAFPAADGSSGQHLTTNGSGTLSWADALPATTYGAIGTYVTCYVKINEISNYSGSSSAPGGTVAGTHLYRYDTPPVGANLKADEVELPLGSLTSLSLTGTWRTMSYCAKSSEDYVACNLVRIS